MLNTTDILRIPRIANLADLAFQTKISLGLLYKMVNISESFYTPIQISKKNGGMRNIECPSRKMKAIQAWILRNILDKIDIHPNAKAFQKHVNLQHNVTPHNNNNFFLCIDFSNFFGSISFNSVFGIFRSLGYNDKVCYILARICTYKSRLPQGGVTSPKLSNIICIKLDERLSNYSGMRDVVYTRYADDITFSSKSPDRLLNMQSTIKQIIQEEGFIINENKTRIGGPRQQRKVTGLIYNGTKFGIGKEKKRILRAAIHNYITRLDNPDEKEHQLHWIKGWMSFIKSVDVDSYKSLISYWERLESLNEAAATLQE